ncbi:hypothetical protein [Chachezhania sediminis]|uniref:hypothetical protein n=1 Tax=Chachezhania sediminis TaxID=2599291 RepID=UPI00131BC511|nr:hypothetical protein [Chachezhania sediminis]
MTDRIEDAGRHGCGDGVRELVTGAVVGGPAPAASLAAFPSVEVRRHVFRLLPAFKDAVAAPFTLQSGTEGIEGDDQSLRGEAGLCLGLAMDAHRGRVVEDEGEVDQRPDGGQAPLLDSPGMVHELIRGAAQMLLGCGFRPGEMATVSGQLRRSS